MKESTIFEPGDAQKDQKIKLKWRKSILEVIGLEKEMVAKEGSILNQQKLTESLRAPARKPLKEKNSKTPSESKPRKRKRSEAGKEETDQREKKKTVKILRVSTQPQYEAIYWAIDSC